MSYRLIAIAAAAIALQGCATKAPGLAVATENLNEGISKTCTASTLDLSAGSAADATIAMTNDGWCAVRTVERDGQPFQLGLVRQRPEHGKVLIQKLGGQTRLEYTADPGYTGSDRFSAILRSRTAATPDATVQIAVTVSMGEGVIAPAASPAPTTSTAPARPRASTPARRSTTR